MKNDYDYLDSKLRTMNELEIAWLSGLFEGEGCINLGGVNKTQIRLTIPSVDKDVIEKVRAITGIGILYHQDYTTKISGKANRIYRWQAGRFIENQALLSLLLPYMSNRRAAKIQEALAIKPHPYKRGPRHRRQYCKRGHEMTADNLVDKTRCKTCKRLRSRRYATAASSKIQLSEEAST